MTPSAEAQLRRAQAGVPPGNSFVRWSCGSPLGTMVQTFDLRDDDNPPELASLDRAAFRGILRQP